MANSPLLAQRRLRFQSDSTGVGQFAVIQAFAPSLGLEVSTINIVDAREIDRAATSRASPTVVSSLPPTHRPWFIGS